LAVAVHCFIRGGEFVAVSNDPVPGAAAVPGFAAPLRVQDVHPSQVLPSAWKTENDGDGSCSFTYRSPTTGNSHTLRTLRVDATLVLHFGANTSGAKPSKDVRSADIKSLELPIASYVEMSSDGVKWIAAADLEAKVATLLAPPPLPSAAAPQPSSERAMAGTTTGPARQPLAPGYDQPYQQQGPQRAFPQMGPRPGGLFDGDIFPGGDSGNLMGPMHPGFTGGGGVGGRYSDLEGMPTPRFDPYQPPLHPYPAGGRPDNDHLRMPTFDDEDPLATGRGRGRGLPGNNNGNGGPPPGMFF